MRRCLTYHRSMDVINKTAVNAKLIGDPTRATMLIKLMGGRALTATELANSAGVSPQTASSHLAQLLDGEMLSIEKQGRHRYYRLASSEVATALEALMSITTKDVEVSDKVFTLLELVMTILQDM